MPELMPPMTAATASIGFVQSRAAWIRVTNRVRRPGSSVSVHTQVLSGLRQSSQRLISKPST
jgi:hypothetical protein